MEKRTCGGCTICCAIMGVKEMGKPGGRICADADPGHGCGRYETRPEGCRKFACLWLQGTLPTAARPDRLGVMFDATLPDSGLTLATGVQAIIAREAYPMALEHPDVTVLLNALRAKTVLILMRGTRRTMIGPPALIQRVVMFMANRGLA